MTEQDKTTTRGSLAHRLDFINPRVTRRMQKARDGYAARLIARLRWGLPLAAVAGLALLILWPMVRPNVILSHVVNNIPDLVIDNLHYTGLDSKNEPYSLLAAQATKPSGLHDIYDLTKPEGEITLQSGAWVSGKANFGRYDQNGKRLWLGGDVRLFHDKGYEFTTDEAQVDLNEDNAWGDKPVLIQGAFGTIRGQGFLFLDSGNVMVVNGPAKAELSLHGNAASDKPKEQEKK